MYLYLDRPVSSLGHAERFLIWAMRAWRHCRARRLCPPRTLRPTFAAMEVEGALLPFHKAMAALDRQGAAAVEGLAERRVGEAEALLLALWQDAARGDAARAEAMLAHLAGVGEAKAIASCFADVVGPMRAAGHCLAHFARGAMPEGRAS